MVDKQEKKGQEGRGIEAETAPTWVLDDELWEQLIELTEGAAAPCYQCGVCTASCPWGLVREQPFTVRSLMRRVQLGLPEGWEQLWLCTACGQCEARCPRGVPVADVIRGLRQLMWRRRETPAGLPSTLWSLYWNNNPWSQPPSQRAQWLGPIEVPIYDPDEHEFVCYAGCTASYDRRAQKIAQSLVRVLQAAGIPFGVLGEEEPCCGEAVLSLGHKPYFEEVAQNAMQVFRAKGVRKLVTVSPHCYDVFRNHYPGLDQSVTTQHYTQLLADLVDQGRLPLAQSLDLQVTFQDPCYLGRRNGAYEQPRKVLSAIPGVRLAEMKHAGPEAICCGGGGGRMWLETPLGKRFSDLRIQEAVETESNVIATACPFCVSCLEDSLKSQKLQALKVMDVAEIVAQALEKAD